MNATLGCDSLGCLKKAIFRATWKGHKGQTTKIEYYCSHHGRGMAKYHFKSTWWKLYIGRIGSAFEIEA